MKCIAHRAILVDAVNSTNHFRRKMSKQSPHTPQPPSPNRADCPRSSRILLGPSYLRPHLDEAQVAFNVRSRVERGKHKVLVPYSSCSQGRGNILSQSWPIPLLIRWCHGMWPQCTTTFADSDIRHDCMTARFVLPNALAQLPLGHEYTLHMPVPLKISIESPKSSPAL